MMMFKVKPAAMLVALGVALSDIPSVAAQTFTDCNPLEVSCPADRALGRSATYDFTHGASGDWKPMRDIGYGNEGAEFTVAKQGDNPLIESDFYIMFGRVDVTMKAAPGRGIISSVVLQSDCLDEIDWEWLGGDNARVQTNYYRKGDPAGYTRGASHEDMGNHDTFKTYTIDWDSNRIIWMIDGAVVRTVHVAEAGDMFPQTPSTVRVGIWAGGDPGNEAGTIEWAGGKTDYAAGPYTMQVRSIHVTDYSTGSQYEYSDKSGSWESIKAVGGRVNGGSGINTFNALVTPSPKKCPEYLGPHCTKEGVKMQSNSTTPASTSKPTTSHVPTATLTGSLPSGLTAAANVKVRVEAMMGGFFLLLSVLSLL